MSTRIEQLHIHNFKFFDEQPPIELGGNHLLLYGENGSGKSSVYWSLYTLFECAFKEDTDIQKYFKPLKEHPQSLVNIYATEQTDASGTKHCNSFIKLKTNDTEPIDYEVSLFENKINQNTDAIEISKASDFLNYKVLYKFQDFWNGQPINLAKIFTGYILPYLSFDEITFTYATKTETISNAYEMFEFIQNGPEKFANSIADFKTKNKDSKKVFTALVKNFDKSFNVIIDFINANAPKLLKELGYDIEFNLKYNKIKDTKKADEYKYNYSIDFTITSYLGNPVTIERPQSFLNEAKITAIALAIRLTLLRRRVNEKAPDTLKFIVFDDVMISLDMNNRDRLMDYILNPKNKYTEDYQLLFLTHDKNFYDFVAFKVKQWHKNMSGWVCKEMYVGSDKTLNKEYPIFIDGYTEYIEKANKHFERKDYTACALYIRKEVEKLVIERLPDEVKERTDGTFIPMQTLWAKMIDRYSVLGITVAKDIKDSFEQSKLLVLNPQAHHQDISLPVYKVEIEKAFDLIEKLKADYPIPIKTILIAKGMQCIFKHPSVDYTFEFELLQDFIVDNLNGNSALNDPTCKVTYWQFEQKPYWNLKESKEADQKEFDLKLQAIINILTTNDSVPAGITKEIISNNTQIRNSIWDLKDVLTKANINL